MSIIDKLKEKISETHSKYRKMVLNSKLQQINNQQRKFLNTHIHIDDITVGSKTIPVWKYIGWDYNKRYTGAKLREIRAKQLGEHNAAIN